MNKYALGIDLGTNSIGWALVDVDNKLVEKKHLSKEEGERLLSESTHRTLTEAVDDISLGNFQTKLKKVILNLKEAYDDLNPNVDKFDVASTIINGSLNDLKMLDKAIQEFNSEETM